MCGMFQLFLFCPDQPFPVGLRVFFSCVAVCRLLSKHAYATLSLWKDLDAVGRLQYVCSVGRLWLFCCSAICEGVVLTVITSMLLGKWPSTVLHNNIPLQSTLTPFLV